MTQEQSSTLTFNIEEAVWLDQGERIQTIVGLELEPEITMQENENEVLIKGGLHLLGQYRPYEETEGEDAEEEQREVSQTVDSVRTTGEGEREIKHYFPVDVTIPLTRIRSLDDLFVQVDHFDYDLPEPSCIQLAAEVTISGIQDQEEAKTSSGIHSEREMPTPFPVFTQEVKRPPSPEASQDDDNESARIGEEETPETASQEHEEDKIHEYTEAGGEERSDEIELERASEKEDESVDFSEESTVETNESDERSPSVVTISSGKEEAPSLSSIVQAERDFPQEEQEEIEEELQVEEGEYEESEEEEPSEIKRENALYLTEMLEKDESETFTKMKMCIIQENESLDTVASRYGYTVQQLLRWNKMDMNHVEEGEIIYIPVYSKNE